MRNRELEAAWVYHNGTKHSYQSIRSNQHYLDWGNQPLPFKVHSTLEPIQLPHDLSLPHVTALSALDTPGLQPLQDSIPDLHSLARLFYYSAGVTKQINHPGGSMYFRAAACTGALYHIDLYLVCDDLPGLEAGVYHFGPHDLALRKLRSGDYRGILLEATGDESTMAHAPAHIVCTSTYWRNSWKYQARTYRHCFWDSGTILANLLAVASAQQIPARVITGFVDEWVNQLLSLDSEREVALSIVSLGSVSGIPLPEPPAVEPLSLTTVPLSKSEVDYPSIRAMHGASSLFSKGEVAAWGTPAPPTTPTELGGPLFPLVDSDGQETASDPLEQVIGRRGSSRRFAREPISFKKLSWLLRLATRQIPADYVDPSGAALNDLYLIAHAVDNLPSGAYVFHRAESALELLKEGDFREHARYLDLGQDLAGDASVAVFFLADLNKALERFGNRGYRAAQLEASIAAGKLYLAAYAQGLRATGLTFYDDDVTSFFSPHAQGKSVMFLVVAGRPARRHRP